MTELSFLLELLLEHKLGKSTKDAIKNRIKDIELKSSTSSNWTTVTYPPQPQRPLKTAQSPSTQRILDEMANEQQVMSPEPQAIHEAPGMPAVIAQTPAAIAALNARAQAISIAISGREQKGRQSPRKF